jgi:hypothetical protein
MMRKIPIISLEDFEAKAKKPVVIKSLVTNIAEGIEDKLESVNIVEIKHHDLIITIPKSEWKSGLENAMEYYIKTEEYEECSRIKKLLKKIK